MTESTGPAETVCPYCHADRVVRNGKGLSSAVQRYLCRRCKRRFSSRGVIGGRRYSPEVIGATIESFYSGMSYRQASEDIAAKHDISGPSKATIHRWRKSTRPMDYAPSPATRRRPVTFGLL